MLKAFLSLPLSIPMLTAVVAFIGGLLPVGPIEILLIILSYRVSASQLPMLITIASLFCLFAKILIYYLGDRMTLFLPALMKRKMTYYHHRLNNKTRISASVIIISAMIGASLLCD